MRTTERIELVNAIARDLEQRYDWDDLLIFINAYDIAPEHASTNSRLQFSKAALATCSDDLLLEISRELDLESRGTRLIPPEPPEAWQNTQLFRMFVSHVSGEKRNAHRLKDCLLDHGVSCFVAHDDIKPTVEWRHEIEKALECMDGFVAMHTEGFSKSNWTQQEVGFALGRGVKIISFKLDEEDPTGFLSHQQALSREGRKAEDISIDIIELLKNDVRTKSVLASAQSSIDEDDDVPF